MLQRGETAGKQDAEDSRLSLEQEELRTWRASGQEARTTDQAFGLSSGITYACCRAGGQRRTLPDKAANLSRCVAPTISME